MNPENARPPERIVLPGLLLRRWSERDAMPMKRAVEDSFEHLHPWMPWAAAPPTINDELVFIDHSRRGWSEGRDFTYGIFDPEETMVLGAVGLHDRGAPKGLEIGYWVHAGHTRRGLATTGAAVLTGVALGLPGVERVEIHCDEANKASAGVPRKLGYRLAGFLEWERAAPAETGRRMRWVMAREAYAGSEAERRAEG